MKSQWKGQGENARYKKSPQITIKTTGDMTVWLIYGASRRRLRHPEAQLRFADCHILPASSSIDKWDVKALKLSRKLSDGEVLNFLKNEPNVWLPNQKESSSLTTSPFPSLWCVSFLVYIIFPTKVDHKILFRKQRL